VSEFVLCNRQRTRALKLTSVRRVARYVLESELGLNDYELGIHFVSANEMARVNQKFLQHEGSTDVITFDYGDGAETQRLHGEIFISVADAVKQALAFRTTWQSEVIRYVIHGLLHLRGFDDLQPAQRRAMKREENRLLRIVESRFALRELPRTRNSKLKTRNSP